MRCTHLSLRLAASQRIVNANVMRQDQCTSFVVELGFQQLEQTPQLLL